MFLANLLESHKYISLVTWFPYIFVAKAEAQYGTQVEI